MLRCRLILKFNLASAYLSLIYPYLRYFPSTSAQRCRFEGVSILILHEASSNMIDSLTTIGLSSINILLSFKVAS